MQPLQICIGPIIRIGRESWCLPYAGFLFYFYLYFYKTNVIFFDMWQVTGDRWHMTGDTWQVTGDMWHKTHDT